MHAYAGISYIELGGAERPLKFGTNQAARFCEIRKIELDEYGRSIAEGLKDLGFIRDLLYSGLWAGAMSTGQEFGFNAFQIGDMMDEAGLEYTMTKLTEALQGIANPNENRAQRRAKKEAKA